MTIEHLDDRANCQACLTLFDGSGHSVLLCDDCAKRVCSECHDVSPYALLDGVCSDCWRMRAERGQNNDLQAALLILSETTKGLMQATAELKQACRQVFGERP